VERFSERARALAVVVVTIAAGLASRALELPVFVKLYVGDVLWGALFFQLFRLFRPALSRSRCWLWSLATTELIEFSQLWQAPWLVELRATSIGGLMLGHRFLLSDVICLALGASAAALLSGPRRGRPGRIFRWSQFFGAAGDDWGAIPTRPLDILVTVMRDTSESALERYYELLRARTPVARLTAAADLSSAVRQLAESSIRAAEPGAPAGVVRARLALRLYGREVAARLFPGVELDVG
jgi:hypothetical protein